MMGIQQSSPEFGHIWTYLDCPPLPKPRLAISAPPSPGKSSSSWRRGLVDGHLRRRGLSCTSIHKWYTNPTQVITSTGFSPQHEFWSWHLAEFSIFLWWKSELLPASSSTGVSWLQQWWGIGWSSFLNRSRKLQKGQIAGAENFTSILLTTFPLLFPSNTFRMG